jgi:hypothetical protein
MRQALFPAKLWNIAMQRAAQTYLSPRRTQPRCAVQEPEQRSLPDRPVQRPRPDVPFSLPEPDACLSMTVTDTRAWPLFETRPLNLTRFEWLTMPLLTWTLK